MKLGLVSALLVSCLGASGCSGFGPNVLDGPVGFGEAQLDNQSDAQLDVVLLMAYTDDVEASVEPNSQEILTNLNGNFGTTAMICSETTGIRIVRSVDQALVLDQSMCEMGSWSSESTGELQSLWTLTVTQPMVDAAVLP